MGIKALQNVTLVVLFFSYALVLLGSLIGVEANISSTAPSMVEVTPPSSVLYHDTESNTQIIAFVEKQNHVLSMPITVDITASGTYSPINPPGFGSVSPGVIPANTAVNSYFIHFDPVGTTTAVFLTGSIILDEKIIGVIVYPSSLDASDGELGSAGTSYPVGRLRGLESSSPDFITVDIGLAKVDVDVGTSTQIDQVRIITESKPLTVGGEMFPVDTTALLLAATYSTASWMIPLMIAVVGFGIIITHQKTKLKHNSCPSCKLETEDFFELGDKVVSKCDNPKCRVNLFFIRRYRNSFK